MSDEIELKPAHILVCGLIMPISLQDGLPPSHWEEMKDLICQTVEGIPDPAFSARLVSEGDDAGVIHKRIIQNVYSDDIAICDVSGRNANVMFELGMRLAFDKPTVIIKDDQTPRIFDTDVIEYVTYRRDLRYASMESFKAKLASKVAATYKMSQTDHDKQSFLKSFGTFKVVKLDEASESPDKALLTMMANMERQITRLSNAAASRGPRSAYIRMPDPEAELKEAVRSTITGKELESAINFIRAWKAEHPEFDAQNCMRDADFIAEFLAVHGKLAESASGIRSFVRSALG